jgi:CDP-glycerol glycerophosphotransferase
MKGSNYARELFLIMRRNGSVDYMRSIFKKILPQVFIRIIRRFISGNYNYFLWIFPIKKNKIVICNYYGKGYGDNGKYIVEKLIEKNIKCEVVWLLKKDLKDISKFPNIVRTVDYGSIRALYELATAGIWIDNCRKIFSPPKRKKQFYIQTWHGGIALKRIEKDVENKLSDSYVENAKLDSKLANLFISNSKFCTELYKSAFWYRGEIIESGYPRNDTLITLPANTKNKVYNYYGLDGDAQIILYAPTFRINHNTDVYDLKFKQVVTAFEKKFGGNWVILVRLHPNISQKADSISYNERIINATHYEDLQELMVASTVLITDYSSSMFEFMITHKPVFLYATDIEEYKNDRDLYFDIFSLPFTVAESNKELIQSVEDFNKEKYLISVEFFINKIGLKEDGAASERVVEIIKLEMLKG